MAIDLTTEQTLSLTEATRAIPPLDGKRPVPSTVWRWARKGLRGVRLEYCRVGHRVVTSREALSRFANRLAELDAESGASAPGATRLPTDGQRQRSIDDAQTVLANGGLL